MSRWTEQFKSHPIHVDWARLSELLTSPFPEDESVAVGTAQEYARLCKASEYIRGIIENVDPELLPPTYLGNLQPHLQQAANEVNAFRSNGNIGHLQNANASIDQVLSIVCQYPMAEFGSANGGLTQAANSYADAMSAHATAYAARIDQLAAAAAQKMLALGNDVRVSGEAVAKLDDRVASVETAVQSQLSNFNVAFQASETGRVANYDAWYTKFQDKAADDYSALTKTNAAGLLAMQSFQQDAEKVLGAVIDTGQAGAYARYASDEKRSANTFRMLAIISMVAAALVLFVPEVLGFVTTGAAHTIDWKQAFYRLPFSLVLLAPAYYLAKESGRHRTNEVLNRRRQHILTTIGPYLALLPKEKAESIKADVAKSIFADGVTFSDEKGFDISSAAAQISQLLATLAKGNSRS